MRDPHAPEPMSPHAPDQVATEPKVMSDMDVLREVFTYHAPSPYQHDHYEAIRSSALALAITIYNAVPRCADRSAAIRLLRECVMTANAAIALHGLV